MADQTSTEEPVLGPPAPASAPPPLIQPEPQAPPPLAAPSTRPLPPFRPLRALFVYLIVIFIGAAIIAPRFHASAQYLAENQRSFRALAEQPFRRYVGRCLLLLAVVGLPIFLKALRIPSASALGLRVSPRNIAEGAQGFALGFALLAMALALTLSFHGRILDFEHSSDAWEKHWRNTAIAALLVPLFEELLFRGALFGTLRRIHSFWRAAVLSGAIYALLHFFERPSDPASVEWYSGFVTLGQMFQGFTRWQLFFPGFLNLTMMGIIFALAVERTGSLLFSVGLHSSLILCIKSAAFLTKATSTGNTWLWGSDKLVDGWAGSFLLVAVLLVLHRTLPDWKQKNE